MDGEGFHESGVRLSGWRHLKAVVARITPKNDIFDDTVAFKTAWKRVVPELAKIFRGSGIME